MKTLKDTILSMLENGEVRRNELFMLSMLHEGEYKSSEIHKTIEILKEEGLISERIAFVSDLEYKTAFYYLNK